VSFEGGPGVRVSGAPSHQKASSKVLWLMQPRKATPLLWWATKAWLPVSRMTTLETCEPRTPSSAMWKCRP